MNRIFLISLAYLLGIGLFLILNEINYRYFHLKGEYTRKLAHVAATLATIPFPYIFDNHWYILILALIFCLVLFVTQRGSLLDSIHDVERRSIGSYLLPISIYMTFLFSSLWDQKILFILPMAVLAVCDPAAALIGMNIKKHNRGIVLGKHRLHKTWMGSIGFFVTCFVLTFFILYINNGTINNHLIWTSLLISLVGMVAEMLSWRGSDNLSIPLSVMIMLLILW